MSKKDLERKQREEQEATAHAFQEFIEAFQDTPGPTNKIFVKSGILNAKTGQEIESEKGKIYNPQPFLKQYSSVIVKNAIECARLLKETRAERSRGQEKPKSNLELLKEELKLRHMEREEKGKVGDDSLIGTLGASSTDSTTTNLFIANLNPKVTEQDLIRIFGAYGPLASIKIMWPRTEEKNRTNCGFVAFMSRSDGERAMNDLKNRDDMRVGWGKPVELPTNPVYIPPELLKLSLPPPFTGLPFNAQPVKQPFKYPTTEQEMQELLYNSVVKVTIPLDKKALMTVHRVIEFVIREGPLFEAMLMNREINNPAYKFLFDNRDSEHIYYRWKLYSLLQGESQKNWSTKEFRMFKNGSIWCPPVIPNYTKGMPEHLIKMDKTMLTDAQKARFIQLIQTLTPSKKKVGEVMVFCLNHADAARDVVNVVVDSFMNESTKPTKKLARLYLLSDVLYNSSMKKSYASNYSMEYEKHLVDIFKQLNTTFRRLTLTSDKEAFKTRVLNVLRSWDLWRIYPNIFLNTLENTFLGQVNQDNDPDYSDIDEPLDGASIIKRSLRNSACILKEEPPIKDEPKPAAKQEQIPPGFIPSKWETVDPEQVEAQAMSTKKFYDLEIERLEEEKRQQEESPPKKISQQDREILRKVELMVMQYQEEYECGTRKLKKGERLEQKLEGYRARLLEKVKKESKDKKESSSSDSSDDNRGKESHSRNKKGKKHKRSRDYHKTSRE